MKNIKIKRKFLFMSLIIILLTTACGPRDDKRVNNNNETQSEKLQDSSENSTEADKKSIVNTDDSDSSENGENSEQVSTKEISIYTINDSTSEVEVVTTLIPEDSQVTPDLVVQMVTEALADQLVVVGIDEVKLEGDAVVVSFLPDQPPVTDMGSGVEEAILNAYAQSLVDNLTDYPKVIFRVNGKAYVSGHYEFGINEVYLDGSTTN